MSVSSTAPSYDAKLGAPARSCRKLSWVRLFEDLLDELLAGVIVHTDRLQGRDPRSTDAQRGIRRGGTPRLKLERCRRGDLNSCW